MVSRAADPDFCLHETL